MKPTIQNLVNAARAAETAFRNFASEDPGACLTAGSPHAEACELADKLNEACEAITLKAFIVPVFITLLADTADEARESVSGALGDYEPEIEHLETVCVGNLDEVRLAEDGIKVC